MDVPEFMQYTKCNDCGVDLQWCDQYNFVDDSDPHNKKLTEGICINCFNKRKDERTQVRM